MYRVRKGTKVIRFRDAIESNMQPHTLGYALITPVTPNLADTLVLLPGSPFWNVKYPPTGFTDHYAFKEGQHVIVVKAEDVEFVFPQF